MRIAIVVPLATVLVAGALTGAAQQPSPPVAPSPTPRSPGCDAPEYRQFDFWVGSWRVTQPDGSFAGTNRVEPMLDGCVLYESWAGAGGSRGHSFNIYSRQDMRWHQTWVDSRGSLLELSGGLKAGSMVMRGSGKARDGAAITHRITWTPRADGTVRQHWEVSRDGGTTWSTVFDGLYTRSAS